MNKRARLAFKWFLIGALIVSILFMYFVLAAHTITTSAGGTSYNINEDVQVTYNISVNVTGAETANVTQVNITFLDSSFLFTTGTQGTSALGSFTNTSSVLSWTNSTFYLINATTNGEIKYFWFNATASTPGDYNITVTVLNGTGAFSSNISVHVNDTTAPSSIEFVSPTENNGSTLSQNYIRYNVTATDNGAISAIVIRLYNSTQNQINSSSSASSPLSGNFSGLSDGNYYINATVNDTAGYSNSTTTTRIITLDTTAPSISIVYPANTTYNINVSQLNYTHTSGASCWYSRDSGATNSTSVAAGTNFTSVTSVEGSNTWTLYCNDTANNINSTSVTFTKDTVVPIITIASPLNQTYTTTIINFNVSLNEAGSWCGFSLDSAANVSMTAFNTTYFNYTNSTMTQGSHNIVFACNDTAGNMNSSSGTRTFSIDSIVPAVTINLPLAQNYTTLSVNITLNENGYCEYSLNSGVTNYTMQNNGNRDFNSTNTSIADGSYTVTAYCNDTAGNKNYTTTRGFQIDNTYPLISYGSGMENNGANVSRNWIYVNVSVTETTETNITFLLYNSTSQVNLTTSAAGTRTINWTGLADGTYTYNVTVRDALNKANTTVTYTIKLDLTAPVITLMSPTNANSTQNAPSVTFTFNVTDDSTVSNCSLILNGAIVNINNSGVNRTGGTTTFVNLSYSVSNTWSVNCTDNANNKANSSSWSFSVLSFQFNGTARDENGNALNNSVINVTIRNQANWGVLAYTPTTSNASGWFNFSIASNSSWVYETIILHRNATNNNVDFRSKAIPPFSIQEMPMLAGTTFYLTEAGTINITAVNETGGRTTFQYQIKDQKLGYPIAEDHTNYVSEVNVYAPKNRNYSIMIYPNQNMPVSYDWNNFSSTTSYTFSYGSNYNATTKTLHKQFNVTTALPRVSGYINYSGISGWDEFTVVPYLLEPGNMIHSEYGDMPYNMSGFGGPSGPSTDKYNLSTGFFNISIPATVESSTLILFATARNGSNYIGGFRNISLSYSTYASGGELTNFNFTQMSGLLGNPANISMDKSTGGQINITTKKQTFNLVNITNSTLSSVSAHIETTVDYSSLGAIEFTWMSDIAQTQTTADFTIPLLNATGIKEMNVYASGGPGGNAQYAPRRVPTMTATQITANNNITIKTFNPGAIDESINASSISIALFTSNATCDIPNPSSPCYLGGPNSDTNMSSFNPMQAVMGGGKISFRMGYSGILVHYVNVDMLASGPPDALFDSSANTNATSGSSFASALRFGSLGPTIYDYVLVSIPYSETAGSGLNDSASVNISVPLFYDDNWNVIWNTTANGSSASALAGNYSHYSTYQNAWGNLTTSKTCTNTSITSVSQINETNPCYIDTTNNRIWIRLPHFSGTGPSVSGSVVSAASTTTPGGGGGGGTGSTGQNKTRTNSWIKITPGAATIWKLSDRDLGIKQINITVNNPAQNVKITITKYDGKPAEVTIEKSGKVYKYLQINVTNLEKNLSKAVLTIQVEKSWLKNKNLTKDKIALFKFDGVWKELKTDYKEEDSTNYYYDSELTSFSYFAIAEKVEAPTTTTPITPVTPPAPTTTPTEPTTTPLIGKTTVAIIIGAIIAVIVIILVYYFYKKK